MLCTHQRAELLTLCLVSLTTFSIYMNKFNFCTLLIPKGCPIIRGSEQPHSSCCLPQGFRTGRAEGSVKRFLLRDTTNPKSQLPFSASFCILTWDFWCQWETWPNDWSICHHWRSTLELGKRILLDGWINSEAFMWDYCFLLEFKIVWVALYLPSFHRKERRDKCDRDHNFS